MPRKPKYTKAEVSVPVSLHQQESRLLKRFLTIPEVKEEVGTLIAKAIATLDWLLENGTPGTKLGAAQTVLMPFVPRAPMVVENLNYDVAGLSPEQQDKVLRLAREYRAVVGTAGVGRGPSGAATDRRAEAQALLLPESGTDTPTWAGWTASFSGPSESEAGEDFSRGEQERKIDVGDS